MPKYVLVARDGREAGSSRMFSTSEVNAYRGASSCYTFINELTNKVKNVGACRTRGGRLRDGVPPAGTTAPPAAPTAKPVAGWWPFGKKKPKQLPRDSRRMAQTVMYIPGEKGMRSQAKNAMTMRGARRRRRRR